METLNEVEVELEFGARFKPGRDTHVTVFICRA